MNRYRLIICLTLLVGCSDSSAPDSPDTGIVEAGATDAATLDNSVDLMKVDAEPLTLAPLVEKSRYLTDLEFIAEPRPPGSVKWQAVQDLCAKRLQDLGFTVSLHQYETGINVIGVIAGTSAPEQRVLLSAHYDHIKSCAGADDNGTGVAGILEAARVLVTETHARSLVVACWDEEERGLIGSDAYAKKAAAENEQIIFAYVLEMIGFKTDAPNSQELPLGVDLLFPDVVKEWKATDKRGDFIALIPNGSAAGNAAVADFTNAADQLDLRVITLSVPDELKTEPLMGHLRRSDHASFWDYDFSSMMISDSAEFRNDRYHCSKGPDTVDYLDHDFATQVIQATVESARKMLRVDYP